MKFFNFEGESISTSENLIISSVSSQSSGGDECVASNGVDSQLKKIIHIKVNGK